MKSIYKNILIFRTGFLGDTLVSLPAFWAVREAHPQARLTLLSNSAEVNSKYVLAQSILPEHGLFDDWLTYPPHLGMRQSLQSFSRLYLEIRQRKFDLLVYLMTRSRSRRSIKRDRLFFNLAGIKNIVGTKYLLENLLSFEQVRPLPKVESEIEFYLNCLKSEGYSPIDQKPEMLLRREETECAHRWLKENCRSEILVAVAPGSKWQSKIWSEDRYVQVLQRLIAERNVFPVIFGGNEDRETGNRILLKLGKGANAAGALNIRQAAAALEKCAVYLGNDTGTMHLAASVGTPCVAVFAAIDFEGRWNPFGNNNQVLRRKVDCEGCHSEISFKNNLCLDLIEMEDVYNSCIKVLDDVG